MLLLQCVKWSAVRGSATSASCSGGGGGVASASSSSHGTSIGRGRSAARKQAGKHCLSCIRGISQHAYKLRAAGLAASVNTNVTARPHAPPAGCRLRETRGLLVLPETQRAAC